jgi:hypothetical protein
MDRQSSRGTADAMVESKEKGLHEARAMPKSNVTRHASRSELSKPRLEHGENIKVHMLHVLQSMSYHGARRCRTDDVMLSYEQGALY